jgi:hypothetical protein
MELSQESTLEYGLKIKIAELYLEENIKYSQVMTASQNVLRDSLRQFDENLTELIQIASMNAKFEDDISFNFRKYKRLAYMNKNRINKHKEIAGEFWEYLSTALRDNNLLVIKSQ